LGYENCRFYDLDLASAVTMTGQKMITHTIDEAEKLGNNVITSDTDSILFTNSNFKSVEDVRKGGIELAKYINDLLPKYAKDNFNIDNATFNIKTEFVAERAIFYFKRRYEMKIIDREGIPVNEMMYKGISIVRNDTPKFAKKWLENIHKTVLDENEDETRIKIFDKMKIDFINELYNIDPNEVGTPFTFSKKISDYTKILPPQVRGAKRWNEMFKNLVDFNTVTRGKYYYLLEVPEKYKYVFEEDIKVKKDMVISIPDNYVLPEGFIVNKDKHKEKIIEGSLENFENVIKGDPEALMYKYVKGVISKIKDPEQKVYFKEQLKLYDGEKDIKIIDELWNSIDTEYDKEEE
jgi:hypothetical protein